MALLKILEDFKKTKDRISIDQPTKSKIDVLDDFIKIQTNGIPAIIEIFYNGEILVDQAQFNFYRLVYTENKLSVFNPFYSDIKNLTISYSGFLVVTKVVVTTSHGNKFIGSINNNIEQDLINKQKTNPEDDTLILYDEGDTLQKSIKKTPYRSGLAKPTINPNYFNDKGKLQKVERPTGASIKSSMQNYISSAKPGSPQQRAGVRAAKKPARKMAPKRLAPKIVKKKGSY